MKKTQRKGTIEVFRTLGLGTEREREKVRQLADLGFVVSRKAPPIFPDAGTRNNTSRDEPDAKLEPAS